MAIRIILLLQNFVSHLLKTIRTYKYLATILDRLLDPLLETPKHLLTPFHSSSKAAKGSKENMKSNGGYKARRSGHKRGANRDAYLLRQSIVTERKQSVVLPTMGKPPLASPPIMKWSIWNFSIFLLIFPIKTLRCSVHGEYDYQFAISARYLSKRCRWFWYFHV